jgi:hypothetical protein
MIPFFLSSIVNNRQSSIIVNRQSSIVNTGEVFDPGGPVVVAGRGGPVDLF